MDLNLNDNKIFGVPQCAYYGQNERVDELNTRINSRYFPDSQLQPNLDPRSIPSKYSRFPMINRRKPMNEPVIPYIDYIQSVNFNPGSQRAPPICFINNIDTETILRNQTFALQKGGNQGIYIPSSQSELYKAYVPTTSNPVQQPHPDLFLRPVFDQSPHENVQGNTIGNDRFFNHTRTQLRNT